MARLRVGEVGFVVGVSFLVEVEVPVGVEVVVLLWRERSEYGFGAREAPAGCGEVHAVLDWSLTRWRQAPSMTPVAIGQPASCPAPWRRAARRRARQPRHHVVPAGRIVVRSGGSVATTGQWAGSGQSRSCGAKHGAIQAAVLAAKRRAACTTRCESLRASRSGTSPESRLVGEVSQVHSDQPAPQRRAAPPGWAGVRAAACPVRPAETQGSAWPVVGHGE